ncbi:hypothetical protein RI367_006231 [Sorochytrium milnesiophthora]
MLDRVRFNPEELSTSGWMMVLLPPLPYLAQYIKIQRSGTVGHFDPLTCGVVLICHILRVFFWVHKHFDRALLLQSCAMMVMQLMLLELCVRTTRQRWAGSSHFHSWSGSSELPTLRSFVLGFWKWPLFIHYILFLGALTLALGATGTLFGRSAWYAKLLGVLSLGVEACVPMPQAYNNYIRKSTQGLSMFIVCGWFLGEIGKLAFHIYIRAPLPFFMCGVVHFCVNTLICWQVWHYRNNPRTVTTMHYKRVNAGDSESGLKPQPSFWSSSSQSTLF